MRARQVTSPFVVHAFLDALRTRVVIADGGMGTMIQAAAPDLDDFQGHEGCNEVLNATRPDIIEQIHAAYLAVGCDLVETNTFGANLTNLGEYGIEDRIYELAFAGAQIARRAADAVSSPDHPRWVLGSVGPGTRLPSFGHITYRHLLDAYQEQMRGLIDGGADAILIETAQDLLQAKAAINAARREMSERGIRLPILAQVTVETTGTMLVGSEIGAALTALEPLGIDAIGLNCATGPAEMTEHLRHLSRHSRLPLTVMPNAGLPVLGEHGAHYPLSPEELAVALGGFVREYGATLIGGCCGTTPDHLRAVVNAVRGTSPGERSVTQEPQVSSLYSATPLRQDRTYLAVGERANANGSRAFRDAMTVNAWEDCVTIAKDQVRDGAHVLDVCVDLVGRDGVADADELVARLRTASTLPLMLDSTEPEVIRASCELLGARSIVNSVNFEDGDGPGSRFRRMMDVVQEHGAAVVALAIDEEGQARTREWKVRVAERLIDTLVTEYGMREGDILVDLLTFPIATGQDETRRDGIETMEAIRELKLRHPEVQTILGLSNISFGLSPAARVVLNSVFLHECVEAGLDAAILHPSKILPLTRIPEEQAQAALDLIYDRRQYDGDRLVHDPLARYLEVFSGVDWTSSRTSRAEELAAMPLWDRLRQRIIDGEADGLAADLDEALTQARALDIVNDHLLEGMKTVGELFGSGQMQLPFVLQSAEVMKRAVAHLEPHMERTDSSGKGTIVLATVKGDVHDIGKNLVDIILTNNGYEVVNLGIKVPVADMIEAAVAKDAHAIGMSGLLVKSTVIMKDNLEAINEAGLAHRFPVILGGAALTRAYVEETLTEVYDGDVRYARDAFEGLRLMDAVMAVKRGEPGASLPPLRGRRVNTQIQVTETAPVSRSDVAVDVPLPVAPFWGTRVVKGLALADYASWLDERALFLGQWGLKPTRGDGPGYDELVESDGRPRLRMWLDRVQAEGMLQAGVVYGYFPAVSDGDSIIILDPDTGADRERFTFPRQRRDRHLCLADYVRPRSSGEVDSVAFHVVTMGSRISDVAAEMFERHEYRDYMELHGLSVQLTEALAEMWHARIREEWGISGADSPELAGLLKQDYQGERFSFGYPACPDLEDQEILCRLMAPERIGVALSEEFQLHPEQSTSAIIFHHPEAHYFHA